MTVGGLLCPPKNLSGHLGLLVGENRANRKMRGGTIAHRIKGDPGEM